MLLNYTTSILCSCNEIEAMFSQLAKQSLSSSSVDSSMVRATT